MPKLAKVTRFIQGITTNPNTTPKGAAPNKTSSSPKLNHTESDGPDHISGYHVLSKTGRFGFPYEPSCLAVDPIQRLIAIGTKNGSIRICGKAGVEYHIKHETNAAVVQIVFLVNEGGLVCACGDGSLHMWNLRTTQPELTHTLQFKKEGLSCINIPYGTKWLYVGTERGNIYIVNIESFSISGYDIRWNHVIDVSCRMAPGPVLKIEANPEDPAKLLLAYENGTVLWDLRTKASVHQYKSPQDTQRLSSFSWGSDGSRFVAGNADGSCCMWNYNNSKKPDETLVPHATGKSDSNQPICSRINKIEWVTDKPSDVYVFSGGLPLGNGKKGLTLIRGRSKSLLLTDVVIDFCCLGAMPWHQDQQDPLAVVVLLRNELIVFDLSSTMGPSVPWFELPYTFTIHDSPVTCLQFYPDCPPHLLTNLYLAETQRKRQPPASQSKQKWPFTGGNTGEFAKSSSCVVITGHADGSVKFWDASSNSLFPVCKVSVSKIVNVTVSRSSSSASIGSKTSTVEMQQDDNYAVQHIVLCSESLTLAVAHVSNFVVVYRHSNKEMGKEITRVEASFTVEVAQEPSDSPTDMSPTERERKGSSSPETPRAFSKSSSTISFPVYPVVKSGVHRFHPGFQPEVVCQQVCSEPSPFITCVSISSAYGVMAYGNALGVALIDYVHKSCIAVLMNYELGVFGDVDNGRLGKTSRNRSASSGSGNASTNGSNEQPPPNAGGREIEKTRESRRSRVVRGSSAEHTKLTKKTSGASMGSDIVGKDKEDGVFTFLKEKDIPAAGVICALRFAYSYTRKGAAVVCPSLWVGTSMGNVTVIALSMPPKGEERKRQPVIVHNTGLQVDLMSGITSIHLLDKDVQLYPTPYELENTGAYSTPTCTTDSNEKHFIVLASEKRLKIKSLPSMKTLAEQLPVEETNFIIKTDVMFCEGILCSCCLTSHGHVMFYSLPRLSLLKDVDCGIALNDYRLIRTFTFGKEGEALYLASPSEVQRVSFEEKKSTQYRDTMGPAFSVIQAPEPPRKGFFQSLFAAAASPFDREELFGSNAGTGARVASYTAGVGGAVMRTQQLLHERQERLAEAEERTQEMRFQAEGFAENSRKLAEKMANKKWWQI